MTTMTAPEALLIKLSAQQRHDFAACARGCGLDLAAWIVQCADVQAAAAIDAMQALQRIQRPDRKKQRPRQRAEPTDENFTTDDPAPKGPAVKEPTNKSATVKEATLKAARTYNERFRRVNEKRRGHASRDEETR
jgi:hypothetical protein